MTGLRIDHVDGLWDPHDYLQRLQERYTQLRTLPDGGKALYLVVEKILDLTRESLPSDLAGAWHDRIRFCQSNGADPY